MFQGFNNLTREYRINNVASGGTIAFRQGDNVPFFANAAGNVGIGTVEPTQKLHVNGNVQLPSANAGDTIGNLLLAETQLPDSTV